jgi:hypothetical protein
LRDKKMDLETFRILERIGATPVAYDSICGGPARAG